VWRWGAVVALLAAEMWRRADGILEQATSPNAKFLGLIILSEAIRTRWRVLGGDEGDSVRAGIKDFLVRKIIELSSDEVRHCLGMGAGSGWRGRSVWG